MIMKKRPGTGQRVRGSRLKFLFLNPFALLGIWNDFMTDDKDQVFPLCLNAVSRFSKVTWKKEERV